MRLFSRALVAVALLAMAPFVLPVAAQEVVSPEAPPVTAPAAPADVVAPPADAVVSPTPAASATPEAAVEAVPMPETLAALPAPAPEALPHDLSPLGMFLAADLVVKGVMIGLAMAALATWTVWLAKNFELLGAKARARRALKAITGAKSLDEAIRALEGKRGVGSLLVAAADEEVQLSAEAIDHVDGSGLKERVASRLGRLTAAAGRRIGRGTGLLASVGSVSPFVGLFGTVWGIMNAFIGISEAQTTNLAVVAPGIAEALLATALGLVAAIPAVIFYNGFARSIAGYRALLADAAAGVERLISRDLDYRHVPLPTGAAPAASRAIS
jgi:biopolymer transport protein ExbB